MYLQMRKNGEFGKTFLSSILSSNKVYSICPETLLRINLCKLRMSVISGPSVCNKNLSCYVSLLKKLKAKKGS